MIVSVTIVPIGTHKEASKLMTYVLELYNIMLYCAKLWA